MDTLSSFKNALDYIEDHLTDEIKYTTAAKYAMCSAYHFQRMFIFLAGIPLSEYIRRRRLTLAANDLQNSSEKIIDIAAKYGYTSPDAFTRAFHALHGITPSRARQQGVSLKAYPRISFTLVLKGVSEMNYRIEEKPPFKIVGVKKRFAYGETLGASVGKMWAEQTDKTMQRINALNDAQPAGFVGAYSEMYADETTDYYIGTITTQPCPDGMVELNIPAQMWAIFEITGPLPKAMGDVWGRIFSEWFPTAGVNFDHTASAEVEWYSQGDMGSDTYQSEIWIPVSKK